MSKRSKIITLLFILIFSLIQFYPVKQPNITNDNPNDLLVTQKVPQNISSLLKNSCYDCHSNENKLPWYGYIAPSKWLVYHDILEAREELNFSNWNTLSTDEKANALDDISIVISENEMPLKNYLSLHPNAKLSETDKETIIFWAENYMEQLYE